MSSPRFSLATRLGLCLLLLSGHVNASPGLLDEVIVTAVKEAQVLRDTPLSVSAIDEEALRRIGHTHLNETLQRVPGVWISRGNGQENLTAIRSPVLTGAGSCGAFIMAQDGISLRAPGFCNVNQLFESTSETASRIEVIRGPGSSIYGSNALHGVINVLTADTINERTAGIEAGPYDYYRGRLSLSSDSFRADVTATTDGGYKDDSGFDQQKLLLKHKTDQGKHQITTTFSYTNLNQETAGFIQGFEAYKDSDQKRDNPNPEAYRDARSYRLMSQIRSEVGDGQLTVTPYLRSVDMTFLQHFLPGQAIEENGHDSIGTLLLWDPDSWWMVGMELEYTSGFLRETQPNPTSGSAFLQATIPPGDHYDYDVNAGLAGLFVSLEHRLNDRLLLSASMRYQYTHYDYDNQMLDGRTRDDGTDCGFGGCRFSRPADREDTFNNFSPRAGFVYDLGDNHQLFGSVSQGFRAPQTTELYRLQGSQSVARIDPVELNAIELGLRGATERLSYSVALFDMEKDNFIFRDTQRRNVDNGETSHQGVEVDFGLQLTDTWSANLAFTFAEHQYENNPALSLTPVKGNFVDTAPETLGSARLLWQPAASWSMEVEWVHIGEYFLDPQNDHEYEGHDLLHLRGDWQLSDATRVFYRLMNLTDEDYAERADFAFGSYRYFVGTPRSFFLGINMSL